MQLDCSTYTFFDHDSFVNCSEVKDNFDESEIIRQLGEDAERIMGPLKQSELASVIKKVQAARTLSPIQKNEIISSLRTIP